MISHEIPFGVRPDEAVFFLTLCSHSRGVNQLCQADIAPQLLESIAFCHQRGDWWMHLALLMPDHAHMLVSFPREKDMTAVVKEWKKFTARTLGIKWQRDFFEWAKRGGDSGGQGDWRRWQVGGRGASPRA